MLDFFTIAQESQLWTSACITHVAKQTACYCMCSSSLEGNSGLCLTLYLSNSNSSKYSSPSHEISSEMCTKYSFLH
jgi:hypothetical protein